jgi:rSAM/selenodomain-associated transferase 2
MWGGVLMSDDKTGVEGCEFSIIVPVLHEEKVINSLIERIKSLQLNEGYEIIVVDGDPDGRTIRAIRRTEVVTLIAEAGRGVQMNAGAAIARGNTLIFLHADTILPVNPLKKIREILIDGQCVAGAFDLSIQSGRRSLKFIAGVASLRSRLSRIPYGDQAIFIRKDFFREIGGYSAFPVMEDVELMRRIKRRGGRICILPDKVTTSARRWQREGVICCTLRNWFLMGLYLLGVSPHSLARFYKGSEEK